MMLRIASILLALSAVMVSAAPVPKVKVRDPDAVLGKWSIVESTHNGMPQDTDNQDAPVVFDKDKMTFHRKDGGKEEAMGYKLDADTQHLDFQMSDTPEGAIAAKGMYALDGDSLLIAVKMDRPDERPKEAKSGKGIAFIKLRRTKEEKQ